MARHTPWRVLGGKKLTVVCLWTLGATRRSQLVSESVLQDLTSGIAEPFAKKGVRVIGISVGDAAQARPRAGG